MSAPLPPDTGPPTRVVSNAAASDAAATPGSGAPTRRLGLALAVIATAQLMVVLDGTIVNVALPHIQTALGFSDSNLAWVVNVYALVFGGLLLLGGRSGDLLGRFTLLHDTRTEPWGQTVARLQTPEGTIVGISFAPWMTRAPSSHAWPVANPPSSEASVNSKMPAMKTRRRPSRSPDLPPSSSNPPKASAYALTTHSRLVPEKPSAVWMCGRATLTIVASSTTMSCAAAMTASARPSRRVGAPELGVAVAFDAAALLTTRVGCPVSGDVADKTISLDRGRAELPP